MIGNYVNLVGILIRMRWKINPRKKIPPSQEGEASNSLNFIGD
jgi:hypothetical protein